MNIFLNNLWLFRRGGRGDKLDEFFAWIDSNFNWFNTQRHHINIFPEGHRNRKPYCRQLKKGMIRYAYERKLLVQPLAYFGVEKVLDEYTLLKDPFESVTIDICFDEIIYPENFDSFEKFFEHCEKQFYTLFDKTHAKSSISNQRYDALKSKEEKDKFYECPIDQRSITMVKYHLEKNKKKV